jgi:glycine/D-amino acid oxidase-like deaminating enzyme
VLIVLDRVYGLDRSIFRGSDKRDFDVAVIGGGLVGSCIALGIARLGSRVVLLDEGDAVVRASRANFALVWVQSKGLGLPEDAGWTIRSSDAWDDFAKSLKQESGVDVSFERQGGFNLALSEDELERRALQLRRLHNQPGMVRYKTEILNRSRLMPMLPSLGPDVVGASYCPLDGHCNTLRLYCALHTALRNRGAHYLPSHRADAIAHSGGEFRLTTAGGAVHAPKIVIAAGNASMQLAPMVGLYAPMNPNRGQIIVTERVQPFLKYPIATIRQTDEGTVIVGDSLLDATNPDEVSISVSAVMSERAVRMFPVLGRLNIVRMWSGIRVVTLAANHTLALARMIARGELDQTMVVAFSIRRFNVREAS